MRILLPLQFESWLHPELEHPSAFVVPIVKTLLNATTLNPPQAHAIL
jgi:hypothetical protein